MPQVKTSCRVPPEPFGSGIGQAVSTRIFGDRSVDGDEDGLFVDELIAPDLTDADRQERRSSSKAIPRRTQPPAAQPKYASKQHARCSAPPM